MNTNEMRLIALPAMHKIERLPIVYFPIKEAKKSLLEPDYHDLSLPIRQNLLKNNSFETNSYSCLCTLEAYCLY